MYLLSKRFQGLLRSGLLLLIIFLQAESGVAQHFYLFIGTYTGPQGGDGIYVYRFNSADGKLTKVSNAQGLINPSYLAISPNGKFVYACTESRIPNSGNMSSFAFDQKTGSLTFINKQPSGGENPVYVSVHKSNKWLLNGNYTGASLAAFPINADGSLSPFSQMISYADSAIVNHRDNKSHIHAAVFSPNYDYAFVPDLGADKIRCFSFDSLARQPLQSASKPAVYTVPGSGPRHLVFHPNQKLIV